MLKIIICYLIVVFTTFSVVLNTKDVNLDKNLDGEYIINEYKGIAKVISIPSKINGNAISKIEDAYFNTENNDYTGCFIKKGLIEVSFSEGIYSIGEGSFLKNNIKKIILPSSLNYIRKNAFSNNQIEEIIFPEYLYTIGDSAFSNNKLTKIIFPPNVTYIGEKAFLNNMLTTIIFPDSIKSLEDNVFEGNNISNITIGNNVKISSNSISSEFKDTYEKNSKKAGTYVLQKGEWSFDKRIYSEITNLNPSKQTLTNQEFGLYFELKDSVEEILNFKISSYMIRVDRTGWGAIRLALWGNEEDKSNKPKVIMYTGQYQEIYEGGVYTFILGNEKYMIWVYKTDEGVSYRLQIYKNNKLITDESEESGYEFEG